MKKCDGCELIKSLNCLKRYEIGVVKGVVGCGAESKRLQELGIVKGSKIRMLKNDRGPLIICIYGTKLAIGKKLADKIIIE